MRQQSEYRWHLFPQAPEIPGYRVIGQVHDEYVYEKEDEVAKPTIHNTHIATGPMNDQELEHIQDVARSMAHRKTKKVSGVGSPVFDAEYRDWAVLAILADIAVSLRVLATPKA